MLSFVVGVCVSWESTAVLVDIIPRIGVFAPGKAQPVTYAKRPQLMYVGPMTCWSTPSIVYLFPGTVGLLLINWRLFMPQKPRPQQGALPRSKRGCSVEAQGHLSRQGFWGIYRGGWPRIRDGKGVCEGVWQGWRWRCHHRGEGCGDLVEGQHWGSLPTEESASLAWFWFSRGRCPESSPHAASWRQEADVQGSGVHCQIQGLQFCYCCMSVQVGLKTGLMQFCPWFPLCLSGKRDSAVTPICEGVNTSHVVVVVPSNVSQARPLSWNHSSSELKIVDMMTCDMDACWLKLGQLAIRTTRLAFRGDDWARDMARSFVLTGAVLLACGALFSAFVPSPRSSPAVSAAGLAASVALAVDLDSTCSLSRTWRLRLCWLYASCARQPVIPKWKLNETRSRRLQRTMSTKDFRVCDCSGQLMPVSNDGLADIQDESASGCNLQVFLINGFFTDVNCELRIPAKHP